MQSSSKLLGTQATNLARKVPYYMTGVWKLECQQTSSSITLARGASSEL